MEEREAQHRGKALAFVLSPIDRVTSAIIEKTPLGDLLVKLSELLADFARWTVPSDHPYEDLSNGIVIRSTDDIARLSIRSIDEAVSPFWWRTWPLRPPGGGAAGAASTLGPEAGVPAMVGDIVVLNMLALRAIAEFASYYGFPISSAEERAFALHILQVAASRKGPDKKEALFQLHQVATLLAKKATWEEIDKVMGARVLKELMERVGVRVTKQKLADVVPLAGAVVGAGFNGWFMHNVRHAAYYTYRERFLDRAMG